MSYSGKIEEASEKLVGLGWKVELMNFKIQQFTMHVDYDNKRLMINCPKAYHTSLMLDHVLDVISTEHEALTGDECCVEGSYVYSFIGVEVYRYAEPSTHRYPSFKNYMLTGMPLSMFTGEFMPEETTIELTESVDEVVA